MPDMGSPGPYRGELGDVSEGSIRTAAMIRWPGRIQPRSSYAMFSIMDFFPTLARLRAARCRTTGRSTASTSPTCCSAGATAGGASIADLRRPDLVAVRWKQFRAYFADVAPGRSGWGGATLLGGVGGSAAPMNGYPKVFNIESDPREEHNIGEMYDWVIGPLLKIVEEYKASLGRSSEPAGSEHDEVLKKEYGASANFYCSRRRLESFYCKANLGIRIMMPWLIFKDERMSTASMKADYTQLAGNRS